MTKTFAFDVFLSHSSKDKSAVKEIAERLKADGLRVWFDAWEIQPGDMISLKVEKGLEQSRILILVMSNNAFGSEWTTLERHTTMFRDPTNQRRRFIPLLLEDADVPDTLRQFLHVDWRERNESQYADLVAACRPQEEPTQQQQAFQNTTVNLSPLIGFGATKELQAITKSQTDILDFTDLAVKVQTIDGPRRRAADDQFRKVESAIEFAKQFEPALNFIANAIAKVTGDRPDAVWESQWLNGFKQGNPYTGQRLDWKESITVSGHVGDVSLHAGVDLELLDTGIMKIWVLYCITGSSIPIQVMWRIIWEDRAKIPLNTEYHNTVERLAKGLSSNLRTSLEELVRTAHDHEVKKAEFANPATNEHIGSGMEGNIIP